MIYTVIYHYKLDCRMKLLFIGYMICCFFQRHFVSSATSIAVFFEIFISLIELYKCCTMGSSISRFFTFAFAFSFSELASSVFFSITFKKQHCKRHDSVIKSDQCIYNSCRTRLGHKYQLKFIKQLLVSRNKTDKITFKFTFICL